MTSYDVEDTGFREVPGIEARFFPAINRVGQVASGDRVNLVPQPQFHAARTDPTLAIKEDLGTLGGSFSEAYGISLDYFTGQANVVGQSTLAGGATRAFLYSDLQFPRMRNLGTLGGPASRAYKINSFGLIAGEAHNGSFLEAFLWNGSMIGLGTLPGGNFSSANSLNDSAAVVGVSSRIIDVMGSPTLVNRAFLWTFADGMRDLGTLPDGGYSAAWDVNNADTLEIVGESSFGGSAYPHAFRHTLSPLPAKIDLGTLPGHDASQAFAINDLGVVVGTSFDSAGVNGRAAFVWQDLNTNGVSDTGEMRDLNELIPSGSGWLLETATDINNAGQITGYGLYQGQKAVYRLSPPDAGAPSLNYCYVDPTNLGPEGGDATIVANVTDDIAVNFVEAQITYPDSSVDTLLLARQGFSNNFAALYSFPANFNSSDEEYQVEVYTEDIFGNSDSAFCDTVTVASNQPPVIVSCQVTPPSLNALGGVFTVSAEVTDDLGVSTVEAKVTRPDLGVDVISLSRVGSTDTFVANYNAPQNNAAADQVYSVDIEAADDWGETTTEVCGDFIVRRNAPPGIPSCGVLPTVLPPTGGTATITAEVTDDLGVQSVAAKVTLPDLSVTTVPLTLQGGNTYVGSYNAPANNGALDAFYGVDIEATDTFGATTTTACGTFRVTPNLAPVLNSCSLSPTTLTALGGTVTINANATDDVGVSTVEVKVIRPNSGVEVIALARVGATDNFTATYNAPANLSAADEVYTVDIEITDTLGKKTNDTCGDFTVLKNAAPQVPACSLTPFILPITGGNVTVTARVTDDTGVSSVAVNVVGPGVSADFPLVQDSGSAFDGNWSAVVTLPANNLPALAKYQFTLKPVDNRGATASVDCGMAVVECGVTDSEAPEILSCSVSPLHLPNSGGPITIKAKVTDNNGVSSVVARITPQGGAVVEVAMPSIGGDDYQVVYNVPAGTSDARIYDVDVQATDAASNGVTVDCGQVRLAGLSEGLPTSVAVEPRVLRFGQVVVGRSKTLTLRVRHAGGPSDATLVFQGGGLRAPFEILDGVGSFGGGTGGYIVLGPGQSRTLRVRFSPTALGTYQQTLTLLTNDPQQPTIQVSCVGKGCRRR